MHHKFVNDSELVYLYENAIALIFPSKYEGFGLPILEAFASDCPVLASNTTSLPEVGGNAAKYFDPNDIDSMRTAILDVVENQNIRKKLIIKGHKQLSKFSVEKTAKETFNLYKKVIQEQKE